MFKAFEYARDFKKHNDIFEKILPLLGMCWLCNLLLTRF